MKRDMKKVLALLVVLSVVTAACGSDEPRTTEPGPTATASPEPTAVEEPEPGEPQPTRPPDPTPTQEVQPPIAVVLAASPGLDRAEPVPGAPVSELADGLNRAGFALWESTVSEENFVFSPMSVGHALLMARAAADQSTGAAIDAALSLPDGAHDAWNAIDLAMASAARGQEELTVTIADAIFPRIDVQPDQAWIDLLRTHHGAIVESLDFVGDATGSKDHINDWISDQTEGLIPELLPDGFIQPATVLVLADAVYFEARWERVFGKYGPVTDDFTRLDGSTVSIDFMQELELDSGRGVGDGFAAAEIPYVGGEFSMLVIVPEASRFGEIRARLFDGLLTEVDAALETGPFELWLPEWETTSQLDLVGWLADIGAAPGSYPGITPDAFLDAAVHAADIAVDEWGTVAAAATGVGFATSGPPDPEIQVKADKPFLYLIRHQPSGLVLFAGQVTDPTV